jgi:uncharacterized protein YecE (DUF72 family)
MTEFRIGTGGWAYFQVPGLHPLRTYARAYNFVEINSTFYTIPSLKRAQVWRQSVPSTFEFSLRCHGDVTHTNLLKPTRLNIELLATMLNLCQTLRATFLILVTPSTLSFTTAKIESLRTLFDSLDLGGVRIVWEIRRRKGEVIPPALFALMKKHDVIHCVDLTTENPALIDDVTYTRIFGKGNHTLYQFSDEELRDLDEKINDQNPEKALISFHNVRMYKDAARYKIYRETKKFPSVTKVRGLQSLRKVLLEDTCFPTTTVQLIKNQGWKIIDINDNERVHASTLLKKLPKGVFMNIDEVLNSVP